MAGRTTQSKLFEEVPERAEITAIVPAPGDPSMRRIHVGTSGSAGRTVATVRDADLESLGFEVGQSFTTARRKALDDVIALNKARKVAMTAIGSRALTTAELRERIERRGHDPKVAERVVKQMVADHWLDDEQFARDLVDEMLSRKPAGKPLLMQKLEARRVPRAIAERVVDESLDEVDPKQAAMDFAKKQLAKSSSKTGAAAARRLYGQLARRGVDEGIIQEVLEELGLIESEAWS